ncbi:MAG: Lrp/AsnC family transcriptional regulator [Salibacteraceae bacterium]
MQFIAQGNIPMPKLDATDRLLLNRLQANSKLNIKALANELNLTKTPVYERIKRYEKEGIIEKYVAVIDRDKIMPAMVVFCSVSLESQKIEAIHQFGDAVNQLPEVMESYLMGGTNDFLLKVVVQDLNAYHHFSSGKLAALPHVRTIKSSFVLNEMKRSTVYPLLEEL